MIERADLPVEALTVDPMQSRKQAWTGDDTDQQLVSSIDADGLYHDLIVRPVDAVDVGVTNDTVDDSDDGQQSAAAQEPQYAIVAGSRRYHAAMEAGYETIPCKILKTDDLDAAWTSLLENTDRRELSEQEIAEQLNLIYELIRPRDDREVEVVDDSEANELLTQDRFDTEQGALQHLAERFYGRSDDGAVDLIKGHLRTADLPPVLQALFKTPSDRTTREQTALDNYGIDTRSTLGSGEGKSGTSREIVALHNTLEAELDTDTIDPTAAVLETVGSLRFDEMSEQELRRSLRDFRNEVSAELDENAATEQEQVFQETLRRHADDLRELHEEIEPTRPFKKVDILGPETQHHSRWHVQAMRTRGVDSHSELVRELYQERLEALATEQGWD
jgi:hypothetical protein